MELAAAGEDMKKLREIARVHIARCEAGDMQAIKDLADRLDGRPAQMVEDSRPDSEPITRIVHEIVHVTETPEPPPNTARATSRRKSRDGAGAEVARSGCWEQFRHVHSAACIWHSQLGLGQKWSFLPQSVSGKARRMGIAAPLGQSPRSLVSSSVHRAEGRGSLAGFAGASAEFGPCEPVRWRRLLISVVSEVSGFSLSIHARAFCIPGVFSCPWMERGKSLTSPTRLTGLKPLRRLNPIPQR
jgi:hypothetical protein